MTAFYNAIAGCDVNRKSNGHELLGNSVVVPEHWIRISECDSLSNCERIDD